MNRIVSFLALLTLLFSVHDIQAQSLRQRLMQKLNKKVEIKDKSDSTTVVETEDASSSSNARMSNQVMMDALGLTGNVHYESEYSFDAYIQMEISNYKKNGKLDEQVYYDNHVNKTKADYAMVFRDGGDKSTIIFDTENSAMVILTDSDGEKTGFATSIDPETMASMAEKYADEEVEEDPGVLNAYNIKKTGKST